jgi:hypothetical protein
VRNVNVQNDHRWLIDPEHLPRKEEGLHQTCRWKRSPCPRQQNRNHLIHLHHSIVHITILSFLFQTYGGCHSIHEFCSSMIQGYIQQFSQMILAPGQLKLKILLCHSHIISVSRFLLSHLLH